MELHILLYAVCIKALFFVCFKDCIYSFLERGEGRDKEKERSFSVWLPLMYPLQGTWPTTQAHALTGNRTQRPFGSQACPQSTEPHQPGLKHYFVLREHFATVFVTASA